MMKVVNIVPNALIIETGGVEYEIGFEGGKIYIRDVEGRELLKEECQRVWSDVKNALLEHGM